MNLVRAPGFTLIVILTLALAIGANVAILSVVNPVLLAPLPFPHADRFVHIGGTAPGTDQPPEFGVPDELYFEYRVTVPGIEDAGLYGYGSATSRAEGHVDQLFGSRVTPSLFTTLGAQPSTGGCAQTASFTGKWEGRMIFLRPDGSEGDTDPVIFTLTQKGKALTGTFGSGQEQWPIDKGAVTAGKATFETQQPNRRARPR